MEETLELVDLKNKYKLLRSQSIFYNDKAKEYQEERTILRHRISELLKESNKEKKLRNNLNQKVSEIKQERESIKKQLDRLILQFQEVNNQVKNSREKSSINNLKKQIRQAEWSLQTKKLSSSEEKLLINKIDELEAKISKFQSINKISNERKKLNTQIESIKAKLKILSDQIQKYSQESQIHHNKMTEILNQIDNEIKVKADKAHQNFLEAKAKADELYSKSQTLIPRINEIMDELGEIQNMKNVKMDKVKEVVQHRVDEALQKFKSGKRLTLEEFTLLVQRGQI